MTTNDDHKRGAAPRQIMSRLKAETVAYHSKLEALPYFKALMAHRLPLACYVSQLRALAVIHGVFEQEMAASADERTSAIWSEDLRKFPWLEKDLAYFAPRILPDQTMSIEAAHAMTVDIRLRRIEKPASLLGYLYVLEGATLGNSMHRPDIAATFHLEGLDGCRYYAGYQDRLRDHWHRFSRKVDQVLAEVAFHDDIVDAAREAFVGLEALYGALYPLKEDGKSFHASRINPEAGHHPMPEDEREIRAALKASDRSWAAFPYFEKRYGARGKRFSDSDTCWLVTLTALDQPALQRQIDWLCRVLASRGMPSLIMEKTMRILHEELINAVSDKSAMYAKLRLAADTLNSKREKAIPETVFELLAHEFDQAVGPAAAAAYPGMGRLLAAAVADEIIGLEGAVDALRQWLTDEKRFSREWIQAVHDTLQKARRMAS